MLCDRPTPDRTQPHLLCKRDDTIHYHVGFGNFIDVICDACGGTGYVPEAMEVLLDGKNIRDILEMSVEEA